MYLFCLLYFLSHILAVEDHSRIYFVTDKTIKKLLKDDGTELTDLELKENANGNDSALKILWDQHNLKPEFYYIEYEAFLNSNAETKLLLKCLSDNNEEVLKFELECNNGKLLKVNFYDIDGKQKRISRLKEKEHAYIVSSRGENIDSIRNSLKYMRRVSNPQSSCHAIIEKFNKHIRTVRTLRDKTIGCHDYNGSFILRIWEVEKYVLGMVNILLKTLSNLLIVGSNKFEFVKSYDNFKRKMEKFHNKIKSLKDTLNIEFMHNKEKGKEDRFLYQKIFVEDAEIILKDLKSGSSDSIDQKYKVLLEDLKSLDLLVNKSTEKNEANDKITVDCDVETVDKFVEKYSLRLLEYCNIMGNYDQVFLNEINYYRNTFEENPDFTALEDAFDDILIAREMKKYLLNYQNDDKTDFLIFSQTDYFRNKLSQKIKVNLICVKNVLLHKLTTICNLTRHEVCKLSHDDNDCYERIIKLQKDFKSVFNSDDPSVAQSFQTIITNLECNPLQNDITPSRNGSDNEDQNLINGQLELNNDENQNNNTDQTNKDQNQDKHTNQTNLDENQNTNTDQTNLHDNQNNNTDQTNKGTKLEENNISKDETKESRTEISNNENLHTDNNDKREKGQELNKDIEVTDKINYDESKNLRDNDKENNKILQNNEQNPKDNLNQTNNKIYSDKNYGSNSERSDRPGESKAENKTSKNDPNLEQGKKTLEKNEINNDAYPKENIKGTKEKEDGKSTFLKDNSILIIACLAIASIVFGVSIFYFRRSQ